MFNNYSAQIVAQQGYSTRSSTGNIQQQNNPTNIYQSSTNTNQNVGNIFQNNNNQNNNFIQQNIAPQRDSNTYMHQQQLIKTLARISQFGRSDDINKLIVIIQKIFEQTDGILKRACEESNAIKEKKEDTKKQENQKKLKQDIKAKYNEVKQRNSAILKAMLNLRQKMMNQMFMYKVRSPALESEMQDITQKIAAISTQIKSKLNKYKFSKQLNSKADKKVVKTASINAPLVQLRAASERLSREAIRLKQELNICGHMLANRDS